MRFTQFIPPNGRTCETTIDRSPEIEAMAQRVIDAGGRFTVERLSSGIISLTCEAMVPGVEDGEVHDIAIQLTPEGPGIGNKVDALVRRAAEILKVNT